MELASSTQFNQVQSHEFLMKTSLFFHTSHTHDIQNRHWNTRKTTHAFGTLAFNHGWCIIRHRSCPIHSTQDSTAMMIYIMGCWRFYNRVERWITSFRRCETIPTHWKVHWLTKFDHSWLNWPTFLTSQHQIKRHSRNSSSHWTSYKAMWQRQKMQPLTSDDLSCKSQSHPFYR